MAETPFHKTALLALLKAHPERATTVLEKMIGGLPDSLDYADLSSANLAQDLLEALTQEQQLVKYGVLVQDFSPGGVEPLGQQKHRQSEDHNEDPVCACSWNPALEYPASEVKTRADARRLIWSHIAAEKHFPGGEGPYFSPTRGLHHLVNEGGPICNCGWSPNSEGGREAERQAVREHIAEKKEEQVNG